MDLNIDKEWLKKKAEDEAFFDIGIGTSFPKSPFKNVSFLNDREDLIKFNRL